MTTPKPPDEAPKSTAPARRAASAAARTRPVKKASSGSAGSGPGEPTSSPAQSATPGAGHRPRPAVTSSASGKARGQAGVRPAASAKKAAPATTDPVPAVVPVTPSSASHITGEAGSESTTRKRPTRAAFRGRAHLRVASNTASGQPTPAVTGDLEALAPPAAKHTFEDAGGLLSIGGLGVEELVETGIQVVRSAARAIGMAPDEIERRLAAALNYLRRRAEGDYTIDEFGFDKDFTDTIWLPLLRPIYQKWFRVEVRGAENLPAAGGALLVANHSGTIAIDSLMVQLAVHDAHPAHRYLRPLGADFVFQSPFIGSWARRSGSTLATHADAERLLGAGELVGVWPEGFKGVGKPFRERYKLQRFGRGGFVSAALRAQVPIIPCSIVGAEEIYPMLGNLKTAARVLGAPYVPITPFFPLLGPLGLIPLPSKWIIEFGAPVHTEEYPPAAADDPMLVFDLADRVRETIQQSLYALLVRRKSVFF